MKLRVLPRKLLLVCSRNYRPCRCLKFFKHIVIRCARCIKTWSLLVKLVLCLFFVLYIHFWVFPRVSGSYNDSCYLRPKEIKDMEFLLTKVTEAFNHHNVTYWLDFGTLLGVWRDGEILKHDGDIDIGRIFSDVENDRYEMMMVGKTLRPHGISISEFQATYNGKAADLFRWKIVNKGNNTKNNNTKILQKWLPFSETFGIVADFVNFLMPPEVPFDLVLPTKRFAVYGNLMNIPNKPFDMIKLRYPLTWFVTFPYKWKCWFPYS